MKPVRHQSGSRLGCARTRADAKTPRSEHSAPSAKQTMSQAPLATADGSGGKMSVTAIHPTSAPSTTTGTDSRGLYVTRAE
jgi:hypothetical protein